MNTAKRYQSIKIKLFFLEVALTFAYLLFFQFSGLSHMTSIYISRFVNSQALIIAGYLFIFGAIYYALAFPLRFYKEFLLEHKFSLSNQRFLNWLGDEIKEIIISSIISLVLIEAFYLILRKSELMWWLWMSVVWFLFTVFFTRIFPVVILPLFYKYKEIDNIALKQNLADLAKQDGVKVLNVFQIDFSRKTKKANAALVGLGKSKRIILADTLLSGYTDKEIKVVFAHELGHYKNADMRKLIFFGSATGLLSFYLIFILTNQILWFLNISKIYDIEAFPMIGFILAIFSFILMPITNGYSRKLERGADAFSLRKTGDKESFISCMKKLAEQNLSDSSPSRLVEFLFYNHPPISKRIKFAEEKFK